MSTRPLGVGLLGLGTVGAGVARVLIDKQKVGDCRRCRAARQWQAATLAALRRRYRDKTIYVIRERAQEIAGAVALNSFIGELWQIV